MIPPVAVALGHLLAHGFRACLVNAALEEALSNPSGNVSV